MSDKLSRAQHSFSTRPFSTGELPVRGRHAALDRTAIAHGVAQTVVPYQPNAEESIRARAAHHAKQGTTTRTAAAAAESAKAKADGVSGRHIAGISPASTAEIVIKGKHAGRDKTREAMWELTQDYQRATNGTPTNAARIAQRHAQNASAQQKNSLQHTNEQPEAHQKQQTLSQHMPVQQARQQQKALNQARAQLAQPAQPPKPSQNKTNKPTPTPDENNIGASAALMSVCTIISRITGFARTWAMAFALGSTMLSSSYQVANNLPNMLYELVIGGMLVTAFLPVYLSVKKKLGNEAGNAYASNLFTIVIILLGALSVVCIAFPAQVIYTQSFFSDQSTMGEATYFFQIFAIQIVFYGVSSILSGLLNANRDYLWSSIAPVANNLIVIASFVAYVFVEPVNATLALLIIAVGNPLGVFIQMAMQWPALRKNGIRLRLRLNLRDPALRETIALGLPTILVMIGSFVVVSVQNATSYAYTEDGPSIIMYARLWYTLPYSFLAVPITTAMFTELSDMHADNNFAGIKRGIVNGTNQILFMLIPFAAYLIVFSVPLVTLYHAGAFTMDSTYQIASYLCALSLSLPIYGVHSYLQKAFSSLRRMGTFAIVNSIISVIQALLIVGAAAFTTLPIESIAWSSIAFYLVGDVMLFAYLRIRFGKLGLSSIFRACVLGTIFGVIGAAAGAGVLLALETFVAPLSGSIPQAFGYVVAGGLVALFVTFGPAAALRLPEAVFFTSVIDKFTRKFKHS